jgi:general secretion pathway protein M
MHALSAPVRRIAALGLLLLLLLFAYFDVIEPLIDSYIAAQAEVATLRAAIPRVEAGLLETGNLKQQLAQLEAQAKDANGFLPTTTDVLASATLQDLVKNAVGKANGELKSMQALPTRAEAGVRRVSVRVQLTADLAGIQRVFYDLETTPSILFLNNVQIAPQQAQPKGRQGLGVQFDLVGYMRDTG